MATAKYCPYFARVEEAHSELGDARPLASHGASHRVRSCTKSPELPSVAIGSVGMPPTPFGSCQRCWGHGWGVGGGGLKTRSSKSKRSARSYGCNALRERHAADLALRLAREANAGPRTYVWGLDVESDPAHARLVDRLVSASSARAPPCAGLRYHSCAHLKSAQVLTLRTVCA